MPDDFRATWPERLKQARKAAGLTQDELAEATGLNQGYISALETGRANRPSDEAKVRLATVLGVPASDLFPLPEQVA